MGSDSWFFKTIFIERGSLALSKSMGRKRNLAAFLRTYNFLILPLLKDSKKDISFEKGGISRFQFKNLKSF